MDIAFWAASQDGSSWYRTDLPSTALGWREHKVWAADILPATVALRADVIVGSRVAASDALVRWRAMKAAGKKLVLDLDDDYFHIHPSNAAAHAFWNRPEIRDGLKEAIHLADRVTVCSEQLALVIQSMFPYARVHVVPNGLPAQLLQPYRDYKVDGSQRVNIGWAGSQSTATALGMVSRALNMAANYRTTAGRPAVDVRLVGVDDATALGAGLNKGVKLSGWIANDPNRYLSMVNQFDIWVAPYEDTPFNRAKFPTKALEAGFLGIPLIASNIEPYSRWIAHGQNGFLVNHPHEWTRYIKALVDNGPLRQEMGNAAKAAASSHTLQAVGDDWESALTFS